MKPSEPRGSASAATGRRSGGAGAIIRAARHQAGLTLADLGRRCGYSASQISRYERGLQPLTDVTVLLGFADALQIPPQMFGLVPAQGDGDRHADPKAGS